MTLAFLSGKHSVTRTDSTMPSPKLGGSRSTRIPSFFVVAAFISGGTYAVILNFANIYLATRANLDVSQSNLIVSGFIVCAFIGALATGGWSRFLPTNVLLAVSYLIASVSIAAFTLLAENAFLGMVALLANGVCDFRDLSFDVHRALPSPRLAKPRDWTVLRRSILRADDWSLGSRIGEWICFSTDGAWCLFWDDCWPYLRRLLNEPGLDSDVESEGLIARYRLSDIG